MQTTRNDCGVTISTIIWVPNGNDRDEWKGPRGQWPCHCTSTTQDSSTELKMERLSQVVAQLQHPEEFGCPHRPKRPITLPLHIYRPRRMHTTWDEAIQSSGCWVTASKTWADRWKDWQIETISVSSLLSFRKGGGGSKKFLLSLPLLSYQINAYSLTSSWNTWRHHEMELLSTLLSLCVTGGFPQKGTVIHFLWCYPK